MDLYKDILINLLKESTVEVRFKNFRFHSDEVVESECYKALRAIRAILNNDKLDDYECFRRIEMVVCLFEEIGSGGGSRHDWG
jgi:hypothetical protein